jgi:hypothetical protein
MSFMGQNPGSFSREGLPSLILPLRFSQALFGQRAHWGYCDSCMTFTPRDASNGTLLSLRCNKNDVLGKPELQVTALGDVRD